MKKETKNSLIIYFPLALILGFINFYYSGKILSSILVGLVGALGVLFVPLLFKKSVWKRKSE